MFTLLAFLALLLILVLVHEAGHALTARAIGCRVEEFGFGIPPRIAGRRLGETVYSLNALPIGGFVRITGEDGTHEDDPRAFIRQPRWQRALVLVAGVAANLLLAFVAFTLVAGLGLDVPIAATSETDTADGLPVVGPRVEIVEVAGTPVLQRAGVRARDVLRSVSGVAVRDAADAAHRIRAFSGDTLSLELQRDGEVLTLPLFFSPPKSPESRVGLTLLDVGTIRVPWTQAPAAGLALTVRAVRTTWVGLGRVARSFVTERAVPEDVSGPVGIASITGAVVQRGFSSFLEFGGVLSVNLALVNILPIPALDGGRLLFLFLDVLGFRFLRGRPERFAHAIGFAVLLLLLALITAGDLQRLSVRP